MGIRAYVTDDGVYSILTTRQAGSLLRSYIYIQHKHTVPVQHTGEEGGIRFATQTQGRRQPANAGVSLGRTLP